MTLDPRRTLSQAGSRRVPLATSAAATLAAVHPPELAVSFAVDQRLLVIGRDATDAGPALDDRTVSRRHLRVVWDQASGGHLVSDLGSRNGSRLDGIRLDDRGRPIGDGGVVQLGDVFLVYEAGPAPADGAKVSRENLPGRSAAVRALRAKVARAAADRSPVLILGETGTGKEWIARELHRLSGRSGPLVAVNCAALGPTLIEGQLFGHVKGAFTGALADQKGLFRAADGGTLFLDEIGELPLDLQPKLLRVLQDQEILPLGATRAIPVDARLVAATNRDLEAEVEAGGFRRDLHARLAKWEIGLPPLRARRVDLLSWLARLHRLWLEDRPALRGQQLELAPDAIEQILLHSWPDNLRGLERLVHALAAIERQGPIDRGALPAWLRAAPSAAAPPKPPPAVMTKRDVPSREEVERAHAELGGKVHALARHFQRDRKQIYRWLTAYGLKRDDQGEG